MTSSWITFEHSNNAVKKAGKVLRDEQRAPGSQDPSDLAEARSILSNYRSAHRIR
jgi:hypothetical protein